MAVPVTPAELDEGVARDVREEALGRPLLGPLEARKAIEALRFGLVPHDRVADLTLNFEEVARF